MSDIQHAHLYGMREAKYDWLSSHDVNSTDWNEIKPQKPFYLLIPQDNELRVEYDKGWRVLEIFGSGNQKLDSGKNYGLGICTHNDLLFVGWDYDEVKFRVKMLADDSISDVSVLENLPVAESPYWNTARERNKVRASDWIKKIIPVYYRPFDWRTIYYEPKLMEIGRGGASRHVMVHAKYSPLSILLSRGYEIDSFQHVLVCDSITVHHSATRKEGCYLFPLYLYPEIDNPQTSTTEQQRRPNFSDEFLTEITNKLGYTPTPEAIFYYIYAIFHSPTYRTRYAEFLKIDFPRVPLTSDDRLFRKLGEYGEELVALHLMKSPKLDQHLTQIIDKGGEFVVDAGHPKYTDGEVIINKKGDRFTGVPKSVWEFYVGGYQVCHKWLKDRKGRQLSPEDLNHYQKIIVALSETMQIMNAIDAAIPSFPIE